MKKAFASILIMVFCVGISSWAVAVEPDEKAMRYEDVWIYGDYAFTVKDGQATIVSSNHGGDSPDWDDEEYGIPDRPGKRDAAATFPHVVDGVSRMVVPDTSDGYPVVAIDDYGLNGSAWGDIVLPEGLISIGERAFCRCYRADTITVPASVTFIGDEAFTDECSAMLRVTEGSYAAQYAQENGIPYTYDMEYKVFNSGGWWYTLADGEATICRYDGEVDYDDDWNAVPVDLVIPDQLDGHPVTAIEQLMAPFDPLHDPLKLSHLASATIPVSVVKIEGNPFTGGTWSCFSRINVGSDNPTF